jgi:hypothetical protein
MNQRIRNTRATAEKAVARSGRNSSSEGQIAAEQPSVVMAKPDEHKPQRGPVRFCKHALPTEQARSGHRYTRALPQSFPSSVEQFSVEAVKRRSVSCVLTSRAQTIPFETCGRRVHRMGLSAHTFSKLTPAGNRQTVPSLAPSVWHTSDADSRYSYPPDDWVRNCQYPSAAATMSPPGHVAPVGQA